MASEIDLTPAVKLIEEFEGFRSKAYWDEFGKVWTIGFGSTRWPDGRPVKKGDEWTRAFSARAVLVDIEEIRLPAIRALVKVACTGNELCALVSFAYNVGVGALAKSTLLRKLNGNKSDEEVAAEFMKWTKAGGRVLPGLVRRRKAEAKLFLTRELV